jgi:hypothetical protein
VLGHLFFRFKIKLRIEFRTSFILLKSFIIRLNSIAQCDTSLTSDKCSTTTKIHCIKNIILKSNICMFDYALTKLIFIEVILWNWFTQDFFKQDSKIIVQMHCLWIGWQQVGSCVGFTLPKLSFEITTRTQTQIQRLFGWQNTIHSHIRRIRVFLHKLEPATKTRKINYLPEFIDIFPFH